MRNNIVHRRVLPRLLASALTGGLVVAALSGCADASRARRLSDLPTAVESPAAREVLRASERATTYPKFSDIPPVPRDVRSGTQWTAAVEAVKSGGAELQAEVAAAPAPPTETTAFAASAAAAAKAPPSPDPQTNAEAFAQALRDRAKPPAKPK